MSNHSIDEQYDPERCAGPRQPFIDWYMRHSAAARGALESRLNIPYGPARTETLDLFPSREPNSPVLLFIHGGYWRALSSKEFSFVAAGLVPLGVTVAVMDYALCPAVSIADITRQSHAAIGWLARNARQFGGDPTRLFAAGHSAGGQQVGMLLSAQPGAGLIRGGIAVSGLFDLRPLRDSWLQPTLKLTPSSAEEQSPLLQIPTRAPPLLVAVGENESQAFIEQSRNYCTTWKAAGLDGEYLGIPGANHYDVCYGLGDPASALTRAVAEFLR